MIAKKLTEIKQTIEEKNVQHQAYLNHILPVVHTIKSTKKKLKLTRKILKQHKDWLDYLISEHKQLSQYETQGMFSTSTEYLKTPIDYLLSGPTW